MYDGHNGHFAAEIAAREFHHALLDSMAKFDPHTKCTCTFNLNEECSVSDHDTHSRAPSRYTGEFICFQRIMRNRCANITKIVPNNNLWFEWHSATTVYSVLIFSCSERGLMQEESIIAIHHLIRKCEENVLKIKNQNGQSKAWLWNYCAVLLQATA